MTSKIQWTEETWNPVRGCSIVSPGCTNCYAMRLAYRMAHMGIGGYAGLATSVNGNPVWTGKVVLAPDHIVRAPIKKMKPTTWFVNSMSDLFHEDIPDAWIDRVFDVRAMTPWHRYQILTKRSKRMRDYLRKNWARPMEHVWLGVSTERQKEADERIPHLVQTPAAVRFLSVEPFLGPIRIESEHLLRLHWVIIGGESGPGARPFVLDDARVLTGRCHRANVPVFVKQLGASPVFGPGEVRLKLRDRKGGNMAEWPADLRIRQMPERITEEAA
jgi:protein gp37